MRVWRQGSNIKKRINLGSLGPHSRLQIQMIKHSLKLQYTNDFLICKGGFPTRDPSWRDCLYFKVVLKQNKREDKKILNPSEPQCLFRP